MQRTRELAIDLHRSVDIMTDWKLTLHNISEEDLDTVVWRYLTFPKFIHLISYRALWFSRLRYLIDEFEGAMPKKTIKALQKQHDKFRHLFPWPQAQKQFDEMEMKNVEDGKNLQAVNCWFMGDNGSQRMWDEYVGTSEGVAIRSTVRKVRGSIFLPSEFSFIGKVKYIDFENCEMTSYHGSQAYRRAFLKDANKFKHESELRICTMNLRTQVCLDPIGKPLPLEKRIGAGMNNFDAPGLNVRVKLEDLFDTVITAPNAPVWFIDLIKHLQWKTNFMWKIEESKLKNQITEQTSSANSG